jgi:hypothetical protein
MVSRSVTHEWKAPTSQDRKAVNESFPSHARSIAEREARGALLDWYRVWDGGERVVELGEKRKGRV